MEWRKGAGMRKGENWKKGSGVEDEKRGGVMSRGEERKNCDLSFIGIDIMGLKFVYLDKSDLGSGN